MTELEHFLRLKEKVLLKYQEHYPFFNGNWKSFSSQDILNLIDLIEKNCKQSISEKWVYTHLKPETNTKIPRRDMLNILCEFVGFSSWDEFVFIRKNTDSNEIEKPNKFKKYKLLSIALFVLLLIALFVFYKNHETTKTIELKNEFTNEKVKSDEVKVFQVKNDVKEELPVKEGNIEIDNDSKKKSKLIIQSPFYKSKTIDLNSQEATSTQTKKIELKPDDYAMMLKAFMLSDIKDWQTRKEQLNSILSDNLEVIVMLKNDLGAEYFDKEEFSQKLIIPTASIKKMKIIEIKKSDDDKIQFIRIKQE
ncbi:hypothetical protein ACFFLS_05080 [Flavobacterium procerum]|uniref:Uncharacterized protein n=1 Tax=Flavobacterium procerum TaxID=1455569 RepID=A0ABV6BLS6_9FLAO